jgi:hypothetical protein
VGGPTAIDGTCAGNSFGGTVVVDRNYQNAEITIAGNRAAGDMIVAGNYGVMAVIDNRVRGTLRCNSPQHFWGRFRVTGVDLATPQNESKNYPLS